MILLPYIFVQTVLGILEHVRAGPRTVGSALNEQSVGQSKYQVQHAQNEQDLS